ncbi:hypothetical protein Tco_0657036 [Tanacetum coccineum]|uniref:Uncharacterized protein n=1 Tax=Tanacetum coccineum TaxID=301880 RepID=A0ABQ4XAF8_9ASTR
MVASDDLRDALSVIFGLSVTQGGHVQSMFEDGQNICSPGVRWTQPIKPEDPYAFKNKNEDEILLAEEQPLPAFASPTADSPGYVPKSDPEEEPEEDDEDPGEDPADYPADKDDDEEEDETTEKIANDR